MSRVIFILWMCTFPAMAGEIGVGQRVYTFKDKARNRTIKAFVWYPASKDSKFKTFSKGPFVPVVAAPDAPLLSQLKNFPVVLVSHGSGGTADKMFWLVEHLVKKGGSIVVAVNHPGNMTGDNSGDGIMRVWERPGDLTFALNELTNLTDFKAKLDLDKVAAAGHSAGGTTVLHLAGGRFDYARYESPMPNCAGAKDPYVEKYCNQIKMIDPKSYARRVVEGSYRDPRVKAVVALDPGYAKSYNQQSLKDLGNRAMVFVASNQPKPYDEIYSKDFLKIMPDSIVEIVPNTVHMSFLQPCQSGYPKDDLELRVLCGSSNKEKVQSIVAIKTLEFFQNAWK